MVLADQASKFLAIRYLQPVQTIALLPFVNLTYVENTGISFGLLQQFGNAPLIVLNIILITGLFIFYRRQRTRLPLWAQTGFLMILAGASGNIVDRFTRGYVVDFIDFHFWPVFNMADSLITIGAVLYLISTLKEKKA